MGFFALEQSRPGSNRPERRLCDVLNAWRDTLVAVANLTATELYKKHPASVYEHAQPAGGYFQVDADDHFSPVNPAKYIQWRIQTSIDWYEQRIPRYAKMNSLIVWSTMLLGVVSSVLAHYGFISYVIVVTSMTTSVTTWGEFSDAAAKTERYTRAKLSLWKLMSWWKSLDEVEQASSENISLLIDTAEATIAEEHFAWASTGASNASTSTSGDAQGAPSDVEAPAAKK